MFSVVLRHFFTNEWIRAVATYCILITGLNSQIIIIMYIELFYLNIMLTIINIAMMSDDDILGVVRNYFKLGLVNMVQQNILTCSLDLLNSNECINTFGYHLLAPHIFTFSSCLGFILEGKVVDFHFDKLSRENSHCNQQSHERHKSHTFEQIFEIIPKDELKSLLAPASICSKWSTMYKHFKLKHVLKANVSIKGFSEQLKPRIKG